MTILQAVKKLLIGARHEPLQIHGSPDARGERLRDAYLRAEVPPRARPLLSRIEALREQMKRSNDPLTWSRPWLAQSSELRERLSLVEQDGEFTTTVPVSKAVMASKPERSCRSLFALAQAAGGGAVVEMGTNVGVSGAYIGAALERGRLVTLEGSAAKANLARRNFAKLGLENVEVVTGDFADTLEPTLDRGAPVDMAFIDGFHEGDATIAYHHRFKKVAAPGAVLVYDDIRWSEGMTRAWKEILADPDVRYAFDFDEIGVCVLTS